MADSPFNNVYLSGGPAPLTKPLRMVVDGNTDVFRYGLQRQGSKSSYEDPTILGFTFELVEEFSPLFTDLAHFVNVYGRAHPEIGARKPLVAELQDSMRKFFNSQESVVDPKFSETYVKSHYINGVSGLAKLNNKFVKYEEDKLTVTLHEDIGLAATNFMSLYRNMAWGASTKHHIVPPNVMKFVLRVKISEIRNLTSISNILNAAKGGGERSAMESNSLIDSLRNNTSCIIYTLWDCHLDTIMSQPFEDEITQAGVAAELPGYSSTKFDIYYKSVSQFIRNTLSDGATAMDDQFPDLGVRIVEDKTYENLPKEPNPNKTATDGKGGAYSPELELAYQGAGSPSAFPGAGAKKGTMTNSPPVEADEASAHLNDPLTFPNTAGELPTKLPTLPGAPAPAAASTVPQVADPMSGLGEWLSQKAQLVGLIEPKKNPDDDGGLGLLKGYEPQSIMDKLEKKLTSTVNHLVEEADRKLHEARAGLIRGFLNKVEDKLGLEKRKIIPANVYEKNGAATNAFDQLAGDIGLTLTESLFEGLM